MDITATTKKIQELVTECMTVGIDKLFPLSYSAMMSGINCPAQLNYQRISCTPSGKAIDGSAAKVGIFNHKVAQLCIQNSFILDREVETLEYSTFWPQSANGLTRSELLSAQSFRDDLETIILYVHKLLIKYKLDAFAEPNWGISLHGSKLASYQKRTDRFLVGSVDVAGVSPSRKVGVVLDYKTHTKEKQDQEELRKQLLSYIVFTKIKFPELKNLTAGAAYIDGAQIDMVTKITTPQGFQEAFDEFISFIEEFIACWDDVLACVHKKNSKCKYCSYSEICPLKKK